jgi:hypothetical protein
MRPKVCASSAGAVSADRAVYKAVFMAVTRPLILLDAPSLADAAGAWHIRSRRKSDVQIGHTGRRRQGELACRRTERPMKCARSLSLSRQQHDRDCPCCNDDQKWA